MEPIFNREGKTVGWLDGNAIIDRNGLHRAFIDNGAVYTYRSRYLGRFEKGFLRDRNGRVVSFVRGASGGPTTPTTEVPPIPPSPSIPPVAAIPPAPPTTSVWWLGWSVLDFEGFLND